MKKYLTLYELNSLVKETIELTLNHQYWVEAELSEVHEVRGHCYMELVQKDEQHLFTSRAQNTPIARAQAKCWQSVWSVVRPHFERVAGQPLRSGLKVLLQVYPQFHEAFGFSWIITDIDPTFTLGDLARRRQEIIAQLKAEGVFELNKELPMPLFCQNIAVISTENAAGYGDFMNQLLDNQYGFQFNVTLFPAIMQGEQVEQSVINALNAIAVHTEDSDHPSSLTSFPAPLAFDCVVIIRGGGATADLSGFDTLLLAENVANFPIPVITGIGHERDECIIDLVAHTHVKTPTAAAAFIISNLKMVYDRISRAQDTVVRNVSRRMQHEQLRISSLTARLAPISFQAVGRQKQRLSLLQHSLLHGVQVSMIRANQLLQTLTSRLSPLSSQKLLNEQHKLELLDQRLKALDPMLLLQRGYSITLFNGRAVRSTDQIQEGDEIETRLAHGKLLSKVSGKKK